MNLDPSAAASSAPSSSSSAPFSASSRYELLEELGRGSYAVVWRARVRGSSSSSSSGSSGSSTTTTSHSGSSSSHSGSERGGNFVAVKELDLSNVPRTRVERVLIELETMNKLRGEPNVVQLFEVEQSGNALLLGMQLCEGGTLRQYLTNAPKGRIASRDEIIRITRDITIGLGALRRLDLVHRDLKPSNVLFHGNKVLIGDFGMVARISEGDTATRVCGTIRYMAPEMIVQQNYDHRVDLWGLGLIVYEMMVGKHPFLEWADESTCDDVTDAMTKLLSAIVYL